MAKNNNADRHPALSDTPDAATQTRNKITGASKARQRFALGAAAFACTGGLLSAGAEHAGHNTLVGTILAISSLGPAAATAGKARDTSVRCGAAVLQFAAEHNLSTNGMYYRRVVYVDNDGNPAVRPEYSPSSRPNDSILPAVLIGATPVGLTILSAASSGDVVARQGLAGGIAVVGVGVAALFGERRLAKQNETAYHEQISNSIGSNMSVEQPPSPGNS